MYQKCKYLLSPIPFFMIIASSTDTFHMWREIQSHNTSNKASNHEVLFHPGCSLIKFSVYCRHLEKKKVMASPLISMKNEISDHKLNCALFFKTEEGMKSQLLEFILSLQPCRQTFWVRKSRTILLFQQFGHLISLNYFIGINLPPPYQKKVPFILCNSMCCDFLSDAFSVTVNMVLPTFFFFLNRFLFRWPLLKFDSFSVWDL